MLINLNHSPKWGPLDLRGFTLPKSTRKGTGPGSQSPLRKTRGGAAQPLAERLRSSRFPLPTFYINRDCDTDRRANIESELNSAGLSAERVSAIDGLAVPRSLRAYFFESNRLASLLKPGEVGCYASHLKTLDIIVKRGLSYALVLEDDALLPPDLRETVENIVERLPESWDIVHLCGNPHRVVKPVAKLEHGRALVRYSRVPTGAFGYLISASGARKLLAPIKRHWPFDTDMKRPWLFALQIYGVVPKIIGHDDASPSRIQATGGRSRGRRGSPIPSRHSWTGNPLHCPEAAYYNFVTLGPLWWGSCLLRNAFGRAMTALGLVRRAAVPAQRRARSTHRKCPPPHSSDWASERASQTSPRSADCGQGSATCA